MLTRVEISRKAYAANVAAFRRLCPDSRIMGVVKSNAYGHGLEHSVEILSGQVDWFGVNSVAEAECVQGIAPQAQILVMGGADAEDLALLSELRHEPGARPPVIVRSSLAELAQLEDAGMGSFHIKVDTGMSRLGAPDLAEFRRMADFLAERPALPWSGVMTHFADVEDVTEQDYSLRQLELFAEFRQIAEASRAGRELIYHAAASAAAMILPQSRMDLARIGISLYGLWPSAETRLSCQALYGELPALEPVMRWVTTIVHINHVRTGEYVGYGCVHRAEKDLRVAVLPVGYYEGYDRGLSGRGFVLIAGRRARVLGRVCMNMIIVDVTDIPAAERGSDAVLLGRDGDDEVSADMLAGMLDTINYEVVSRIQEDIPRVIVA